MFLIQSNLPKRNFLVTLKLFLNAKCSLFVWSKWQIGHRKWSLNTNLFLIKQLLNAKFDCTIVLMYVLDLINLQKWVRNILFRKLYWPFIFIKKCSNSKWFFQADVSSKKWTNKFYFATTKPQVDLFLLVFWKNLKTPKRHFKINWHLEGKHDS